MTQIASIIDGKPVTGGRRVNSTNPANLDDVVAEVIEGDADTFAAAAASYLSRMPVSNFFVSAFS